MSDDSKLLEALSNGIRSDLKILVADDCEPTLQLFIGLLSKFGLRADTARTGKEAFDALISGRYHIVFMDVQMPEKSGIEVVHEAFEKMTADRRPYVVALTAQVTPFDRDQCFAVGMRDYIAKPCEMKVLASSLVKASSSLGLGPSSAPSAPLDFSDVLENFDNDQELMAEFTKVYLESLPEMMTSLQDAGRSANAKALERATHKLRGATLPISTQLATEKLTQLEEYTKNAGFDPAIAHGMISEIENEIAMLATKLQGLIADRSRSVA